MQETPCNLEAQGCTRGSCMTRVDREEMRACAATLRTRNGIPERLMHAALLSRPENYLSLYQSGCNMSCRKCHSWSFSQVADGTWMSAEAVGDMAVAYEKDVTVWEPREKATAWHAQDTCRGCGACVLHGARSETCPGKLQEQDVVLSPQGFGPARNIVAFTGGDLTCRPDFYCRCARNIKERTRLWVLIETNGYGLTPGNLDRLQESGVDSFWLDIKAHDAQRHKWLTGCDNQRILGLPHSIVQRGFVLEVLSLFIPGVVEAEELGRIAGLLADVDPGIPFTILAFFPEYRMKETRPPTTQEMIRAYELSKNKGLKNIRLGNLGVFAKSERDREDLEASVDPGAF